MPWTQIISDHSCDGIDTFDGVSQTGIPSPIVVSKGGALQSMLVYASTGKLAPGGGSSIIQKVSFTDACSSNITSKTLTLPNTPALDNVLLIEVYFNSGSGTFAVPLVTVAPDSNPRYQPPGSSVIDCGVIWKANTAYAVTDKVIDMQSGLKVTCLTAVSPFMSGNTPPAFAFNAGGTATDHNLTWSVPASIPSIAPVVLQSGTGNYTLCLYAVVGPTLPDSVTISYVGATGAGSSFGDVAMSVTEYAAGYAPTLLKAFAYEDVGGSNTASVTVPVTPPQEFMHLTVLTARAVHVGVSSIVQPTSASLTNSAWYIVNEP